MKNAVFLFFIGLCLCVLSISVCDSGGGGSDSTVCTGEDTVVYVSIESGDDELNPGTKASPKKTIQEGINCAARVFSAGEVHVAEGEYHIDGSVSAFAQSRAGIVLRQGISVYGGYASSDWDEDRDSAVYETVVTDDSTGETGYFAKPNRVFHAGGGITSETVIDGLTINGGGGDYSSGIACLGGSPTIINNTINGGSGSSKSYGIYISDSSAVISDNTVNGGGGGVYTYGIACDEANATVYENIISGGSGSTGSYGIDLYYSNDLIRANTVNGGTSDGASFGVMITGASPSLYNNVISGQGGSPASSYGIYFGSALDSGTPFIANNTVEAGNGTTSSCGIEVTTSGPDIVNNIIRVTSGTARYGIRESGTESEADPSSVENNDVYLASGGTFRYLYVDVQTGYNDYTVICSGNFGVSGCGSAVSTPAGENNVSDNPNFDSNKRLTSSSPISVSQGGKTLSSRFTQDRDGNTRTVPWSMGAFERD
ncbi:MAG TPA: hypothetical protein PK926_00040 [Spirochaetota bacterium]|nr:hypothetical protein [Spirochaetota bacterium]HPR47466.1 hypothetical protein [Spirochaetota bacterium]